ncbi:hypothetical protein D9M71_788770 [compost metagenome]
MILLPTSRAKHTAATATTPSTDKSMLPIWITNMPPNAINSGIEQVVAIRTKFIGSKKLVLIEPMSKPISSKTNSDENRRRRVMTITPKSRH